MTDKMSSAWKVSHLATTVYLFFIFAQLLASDRTIYGEALIILISILGVGIVFIFLDLDGAFPDFVSFMSLMFTGVCSFFALALFDNLIFGSVNLDSFPYQFAHHVTQNTFRNALFSIEEISPYVTLIVLFNLLGAMIILIDLVVKILAFLASRKEVNRTNAWAENYKKEVAQAQAAKESEILAEKRKVEQEKARQAKIRQERVAKIISNQTENAPAQQAAKYAVGNLDDDIKNFLKGNK